MVSLPIAARKRVRPYLDVGVADHAGVGGAGVCLVDVEMELHVGVIDETELERLRRDGVARQQRRQRQRERWRSATACS